MNTNWFWKYVFLTILAVALPMTAVAQQLIVPPSSDITGGNGRLDDSTYPLSAGDLFTAILLDASGTGGPYNFRGTVTLTGVNVGTLGGASASVVATNDSSATFDLRNLSIKGNAASSIDELIGFAYREDTAFAGTITGNANIEVAASSVGAAYGAFFRRLDNTDWADINTAKTISFGDIVVTSGDTAGTLVPGKNDAGAAGLVAGVLQNGNITISNIEAAAKGFAYGVKLNGIDGGSLTVTNTVKAEGAGANESVGFLIEGNVTNGALAANEIIANDTGTGYAAGVAVGGNFDGTISVETIEATSKRSFAAGILVQNDADITIAKSLSIMATGAGNSGAGIVVGDNLTLNLANGVTLTTVDSDFGALVGGDLEVKGTGIANLCAVLVGGETTIGKGTTVAIDGAAGTYLGDVTIKSGGVLEVYGNTTDTLTISGEVTNSGVFKNTASFTDWQIDADTKITSVGLRSQAYMSDGYLAAFAIHNRYTVWSAVQDRMISGTGQQQRARRHGYHGQAPCDPCEPVACDPCAPLSTYYSDCPNKNVAWATYIGRGDEYRSSYNNRDWKLSMNGVQVGTDLARGNCGQLGVLFGYESGDSTNTGDRINAEDIYVGLYAARVLHGGADVRAVVGYGWQDYDLNRWSGGSPYTSSFKGQTLEGNLEIGKRFGGPLSLRPVLGVDVFNNRINGATETGIGNDAVVYKKTDLTQVFVRAGSELQCMLGRLTLNSGIFYAYDVHGKNLDTNVTSLGGYGTLPLAGTNLGRSLLLFHTGGSYQLTQNLGVIGGFEGQLVTDRSDNFQSIGYIGGSWKW